MESDLAGPVLVHVNVVVVGEAPARGVPDIVTVRSGREDARGGGHDRGDEDDGAPTEVR